VNDVHPSKNATDPSKKPRAPVKETGGLIVAEGGRRRRKKKKKKKRVGFEKRKGKLLPVSGISAPSTNQHNAPHLSTRWPHGSTLPASYHRHHPVTLAGVTR